MLTDKQVPAAAQAVVDQLSENPIGVGIPLHANVAEHMGAFNENAVTLADLMDDALLSVGPDGSITYDGD